MRVSAKIVKQILNFDGLALSIHSDFIVGYGQGFSLIRFENKSKYEFQRKDAVSTIGAKSIKTHLKSMEDIAQLSFQTGNDEDGKPIVRMGFPDGHQHYSAGLHDMSEFNKEFLEIPVQPCISLDRKQLAKVFPLTIERAELTQNYRRSIMLERKGANLQAVGIGRACLIAYTFKPTFLQDDLQKLQIDANMLECLYKIMDKDELCHFAKTENYVWAWSANWYLAVPLGNLYHFPSWDHVVPGSRVQKTVKLNLAAWRNALQAIGKNEDAKKDPLHSVYHTFKSTTMSVCARGKDAQYVAYETKIEGDEIELTVQKLVVQMVLEIISGSRKEEKGEIEIRSPKEALIIKTEAYFVLLMPMKV